VSKSKLEAVKCFIKNVLEPDGNSSDKAKDKIRIKIKRLNKSAERNKRDLICMRKYKDV
jgi:hypothetical protein